VEIHRPLDGAEAFPSQPGRCRAQQGIARILMAKMSWNAIRSATACSRATIAKIAKQMAAAWLRGGRGGNFSTL
jgi:hypothetical protein